MSALEFPCAAKTYGDGTWYCAVCGIRGDKDDDVEDYCKKVKGDTDAPPKPDVQPRKWR